MVCFLKLVRMDSAIGYMQQISKGFLKGGVHRKEATVILRVSQRCFRHGKHREKLRMPPAVVAT